MVIMAALWNRAGHYILFCGFFYLLFSFPNLSVRRLDVYHSSKCGVALVRIQNAGLKCAVRHSTWLAENTGRKKLPKICHLRTIAQLCWAISSQLRHVSTIGKKYLLNSNISLTCPHNMANFGPLTAEIGWQVWGTPPNFNGFRVLPSLLQRRRSPEANQTLQDVWLSPGWYIIYTFSGALARCKIHFASKSCFLLYWQR